MISLNFKAAKEGFFDRVKVLAAVDKATLSVLGKFGAFVRRRAKSSIRKRKKPAPPGQPPSSHVGLLKDLIYFSYDSSHKSVVIGPTLSNRPTGAPENLEYGGDTELEESVWKTRHGHRVQEKKTRRATIKARPFMGPAFEAEKGGLPAMWANSVR